MTRNDWIALLDPELGAYLDRASEDLSIISLPLVREKIEISAQALAKRARYSPKVIEISGMCGAPQIELRVHNSNRSGLSGAILHIHGGGMVKGSAAMFDDRVGQLANTLGALVVSVNYRKAPETPFPGPLHDCVAAWNWLIDAAAARGVPQSSCVITGDSSGGGLAAATCLYLRDDGCPMPAGQVLVYPMLDYKTGTDFEAEKDERLGWNSANNQFGWRALLGNKTLPTGLALGHFSPAHAQSIEGLPPTWIGVGTLDLFFGESARFAFALEQAGIYVTFRTYDGAPHGFQTIASKVAARFYQDYFAAFRVFTS